MGTKYQAPNSQYNKDEQFAKLSIDTAFEATLDEAIAVDVDDNKFTVFAYVSSAAGVESYGDKDFAFKAQACKFDVYKKDHKGYQDKEMTQSPLMAVVNYVITNDVGFGTPFKAELMGANTKLQAIITTGEHKGKPVDKDTILDLIQAQAMEYSKLESLDKLKDLKMEVTKGFARGAGANPKKILEARLEFVEDCIKPDSKYRQIAGSLQWDESEVNAGLSSMLSSLMS